MDLMALPVVIGHKPPLFGFWGKFKHVSYSERGDGFLNLPPYSILEGISDKELGEYHFLFGLRRYLESTQGEYGVVIVSHYRRILSSKKLGLPSNLKQSHTFIVTPEEIENEEISIVLPNSGSWLIGTPVIIYDSVLEHLSVTHPLQEYLRMLALAVELEILTSADVVALLNSQYMITAASVGVFPVGNFIADMICLEDLTRVYLDGKYKNMMATINASLHSVLSEFTLIC